MREVRVVGNDQYCWTFHCIRSIRVHYRILECYCGVLSASQEPLEISNSCAEPAAAAFAFGAPRLEACIKADSTAVRRSTRIQSGWPAEYSAWNMTFHERHIIRNLPMGSSAANCALRQSSVVTPCASRSRNPSRIVLMSWCIRRKNARRTRNPKRAKATRASDSKNLSPHEDLIWRPCSMMREVNSSLRFLAR